jgi:hypothetical protein
MLRHGGTYWLPIFADSPLLSPSIRLALARDPAAAGALTWRSISVGFEVADLPVEVDGREVDRIFLARIDPGRFRFVLRTASNGERGLDQWMAELRPALLVNGSYSSRYGEPATPLLSGGMPFGTDYDAKAGAFVASRQFAGIHDSVHRAGRPPSTTPPMPWCPIPSSFRMAPPMSSTRATGSRTAASSGKTERAASLSARPRTPSLARLARFLVAAPLGLTIALNLDGGPVASQAISLNGYERKSYGRWEAQVEGERAKLLIWPYASVAMPVVLAVLPK